MSSGVIKHATRSVFADAFNIDAQKGLFNEINDIGQRCVFDDGREFVSCSTAVDITVGQVVAQSGVTTDFTDDLAVAAAGATELVFNCTSLDLFGAGSGVMSKDLLRKGYITIMNGAGEGYRYRIKSNTVQDDDDKFTITLYDGLKVAVATTSDCNLSLAKYRKVIVGTASLIPAGVAVVPAAAATAGKEMYFWAQTKGPGVVKVTTAANIVLGKRVAVSTAGGVLISAAGLNDIGIAEATPTADGDFVPVTLNIP